ncbi:hypothetical protein O6H91_02G085200 [Diphasiastrum complanatum]|uniref:Uncharacterized protein n=1 Tax=Diphasiastrum complanatum TaxID=34168 RepID=A0ACC2EHN4_DIPCM|nr:hypothetical protein O6H91_02G085200 [Diphasiastrum complanatum]
MLYCVSVFTSQVLFKYVEGINGMLILNLIMRSTITDKNLLNGRSRNFCHFLQIKTIFLPVCYHSSHKNNHETAGSLTLACSSYLRCFFPFGFLKIGAIFVARRCGTYP